MKIYTPHSLCTNNTRCSTTLIYPQPVMSTTTSAYLDHVDSNNSGSDGGSRATDEISSGTLDDIRAAGGGLGALTVIRARCTGSDHAGRRADTRVVHDGELVVVGAGRDGRVGTGHEVLDRGRRRAAGGAGDRGGGLNSADGYGISVNDDRNFFVKRIGMRIVPERRARANEDFILIMVLYGECLEECLREWNCQEKVADRSEKRRFRLRDID